MEFIRQATDAPATTAWKQGKKVADAKPGEMPRGTTIATFNDKGKYPTDNKGRRAAIYLEHNAERILVLDQWNDQGEVKQKADPLQSTRRDASEQRCGRVLRYRVSTQP